MSLPRPGVDVLAVAGPPRSGVERRPIYYSDWQRHWYRLLDFVQFRWFRFTPSRTYRFARWFCRRVLPIVCRIAFRLLMILATLIVVAGIGTFMLLASIVFNGGIGGRR